MWLRFPIKALVYLYFSGAFITDGPCPDSQHNHSLSVRGWSDFDDHHLENVAIMGAKDCVCI